MIFSNTSGLFWFLVMTNLCLLSSPHSLDALKYSSVCVPTVGTVGLPLFPIKFLLETAESEPGGRASISPNCIQPRKHIIHPPAKSPQKRDWKQNNCQSASNTLSPIPLTWTRPLHLLLFCGRWILREVDFFSPQIPVEMGSGAGKDLRYGDPWKFMSQFKSLPIKPLLLGSMYFRSWLIQLNTVQWTGAIM